MCIHYFKKLLWQYKSLNTFWGFIIIIIIFLIFDQTVLRYYSKNSDDFGQKKTFCFYIIFNYYTIVAYGF